MSEEYIEVNDNDFHWYVIPYSKHNEWNSWCDLDQDTEASWIVPDYAKRVEGNVVFKDWREV